MHKQTNNNTRRCLRHTVRIDEEQDEFQAKIEAHSASIYLVCVCLSLSLFVCQCDVSHFFLPKKFLPATYSKRFAAGFSTPRTKAADLLNVRLARLDLSVSGSLPSFLAICLSFSACLSLSLSLSLALSASVRKQSSANQRMRTRAVANEELATTQGR